MELVLGDIGPIVLVDAFSRGMLLCEEALKYSDCIHVVTNKNMPDIFLRTIDNNKFSKIYYFDELGFDELISNLKRDSPSAIIAGSEFGVHLADSLSEELRLPSNGKKLSIARRNKNEMANEIYRHGIPVPFKSCVSSESIALEWFKNNSSNPVVVKPVDSAGSDNVFICNNEDDLVLAFNNVIGSVNLMLSSNSSVLLQEYLEGDEYVVNTVSCNGDHWITDIWLYTKKVVDGGRKIYDYQVLVDSKKQNIKPIINYVTSILDALNIKYGASHTELMLTSEGPKIIEIGARLSGDSHPFLLKKATENETVEMVLKSYLDKESLNLIEKNYNKNGSLFIVDLLVLGDGVLNKEKIFTFFKTLVSFYDVRFRVDDRELLEKTIDLSSSPGSVFLYGENERDLYNDYLLIREFEKECYKV